MLELVRPASQKDQAVQRGTQQIISIAELLERAGHELLRLSTDTGAANGQTIRTIDTLLLLLLDLQHLLCAGADRHVPGRLVDLPAARHVLQALLLDLDVQQHERVQADGAVLLDAVVEARRAPVVEEEHHADRLAKVVQLQASGADAAHDGGVGHGAHLDAQLARAQDEVRVSGGAERVADNAEGYVDFIGVPEDLVAVGFDHLAVGDDDGAAIVGFLLEEKGGWLVTLKHWCRLDEMGQREDGRKEKTEKKTETGTEDGGATYKSSLVHKEDAGVSLEVDTLGLLDNLETLDGNVRLIGETKTNEVQHLGSFGGFGAT